MLIISESQMKVLRRSSFVSGLRRYISTRLADQPSRNAAAARCTQIISRIEREHDLSEELTFTERDDVFDKVETLLSE